MALRARLLLPSRGSCAGRALVLIIVLLDVSPRIDADAFEPADGERYATLILTQMVTPGAGAFPADLSKLRETLEVSGSFGLLALLHIFGVPDERGALEFPQGFPRDFNKALRYIAAGSNAASQRPGGEASDRYCFTALGLLLSLGYPPLRCLRLQVLPGPSVNFGGLEAALRVASGSAARGGIAFAPMTAELEAEVERECGGSDNTGDDLVGAAYWVAAERKEPLGSIAFASLLRRNLTDVPNSWRGWTGPAAARLPAVLFGDDSRNASSLACRALGTLVGPANVASLNEEPLLDRAALTWKAERHKQQRLPEEPDWKDTKEYVETIRFRAEQLKEPEAVRELGKISYEGHTEAKVAQNKESATVHWEAAAKKGDVWSAWYTALVGVQDGRAEEVSEYLDIVAKAQAGALSLMAMHFKFRFGLGVEKNSLQAGLFLQGAADLGYSNAQLILANAYSGMTHGNMADVYPPGGANAEMALVYFKAAAANGRLGAKFNVGLLTAQGSDPAISDSGERCLVAYQHWSEIILRAHKEVHIAFAHARRAFVLGDEAGALLRFVLLSDAGALNAHLNAAFLWERLAASSGGGFPCWEAPEPRQGQRKRRSKRIASASSLPAVEVGLSARPTTSCAFYYHRRAASSGHAASMNELSARHLEEARSWAKLTQPEMEAVPRDEVTFAATRLANEYEAFRWTSRAAKLGDPRGRFDLAYMIQFGIGCEANVTQAEELYRKLLSDGDWPSRVAALAALGLQRLRPYFLWEARRHATQGGGFLEAASVALGQAAALARAAIGAAQSAAGAATEALAGGFRAMRRVVVRDSGRATSAIREAVEVPRDRRRSDGRLVYEVVR